MHLILHLWICIIIIIIIIIIDLESLLSELIVVAKGVSTFLY